jgi:transposase
MQNAPSIFAKQHPKIRHILEQSGTPAKALCVALDYAKAKHMALFCNGFGDILKKAFPVDNSRAGLKTLLEEVRRTCQHRNIRKSHVFFGGEDNPSYVQNFLEELAKQGYLVVRVNAWEAKHQRDNHQASTDALDLLSIAKTLLQKATYCDRDQSNLIYALRELSRTRAAFVVQLTHQKLQIHHYVSRLFPGFLNPKHNPVVPFSSASLALMAENFSAAQIRSWRRDRLIAFLQRHAQPEPQQSAQQLKVLAGQALAPCPELLGCWQQSLSEYLRQYESLHRSLDGLERQMALALAKTSGALLTSIAGIGVVLAAGLVAELGEGSSWKALRRLCSYCGIVPRVNQTGGPDQPAQTGTVQRRCNRRAKNWAVQAGGSIGKHGPAELREQYRQLERNGQHAEFIMSKRLLRLCKDLMRRGTVYRPRALLQESTPVAALSAYYSELWPRLLAKWSPLVEDWDQVFHSSYPLGQWRQMVGELYHLSLPLPHKRQRRAI